MDVARAAFLQGWSPRRLDRLREAHQTLLLRKIVGFCAISIGMVDYPAKRTNLLEADAGAPELHRRWSTGEHNRDSPRRPAVRKALARSRRSRAPVTRAMGPDAPIDATLTVKSAALAVPLCPPFRSIRRLNGSRGERYVVPLVGAPLGPPEALAADVRQQGSARRQTTGGRFPSASQKVCDLRAPLLGRS